MAAIFSDRHAFGRKNPNFGQFAQIIVLQRFMPHQSPAVFFQPCEMHLIRVRYGLYHVMIWALSWCDMGLIRLRNGAFRAAVSGKLFSGFVFVGLSSPFYRCSVSRI